MYLNAHGPDPAAFNSARYAAKVFAVALPASLAVFEYITADTKHNSTYAWNIRAFNSLSESRAGRGPYSRAALKRKGGDLPSNRPLKRWKRSSSRSWSFNQSNPVGTSTISTRSSSTSGMVRRRRYSKRKRSGGASYIARKALSKVRKLERKVEVKMYDITLTTIASVPAVGDIRSLAAVLQGDLVNNRDGNKIAPFFLKVKIHWKCVVAALSQIFRTIIFRDMQQIDSTTPTVGDVLVAADSMSLYHATNRKRFKILFDATWTGAQSASDGLNFVANLNLKLSRRMGFSGAAATTVNENGLYMISVHNDTANLPSVIFTSRLFYNDS